MASFAKTISVCAFDRNFDLLRKLRLICSIKCKHILSPLSHVFFSAQPPTAYSHPSTASYSVQQASAVAHAVTASYSPAPVQAARPVVSAPYPAYQSHQAPPEYAFRQPEPPAPPQPTTTPQTYQVYSDMVSLFLLSPWISASHLCDVIILDVWWDFVLALNSTQQQENYSYGRPAAVTTYDNKQYYQTSIASAQRTVTENYYQTGEPLNFYWVWFDKQMYSFMLCLQEVWYLILLLTLCFRLDSV